MRKFKLFFPALIVVLSFSCTKVSTSGLYTPVSTDATSNATLQELQDGRTLYIGNCGSCHNLFSPDDYSVNSWKTIISGMAPKTSMNASQVTLVTKYVTRGHQ